jgi:phospholipid/cholesterol/gamma-HCH transport system substrate-binding protein
MKFNRYSRELKIGLVTVLTIVAFIWGFNYLKGKDLFNSQRTFYVVYNNVSGLMKANAVTISGLNIGQVNGLEFLESDPTKVVVELTIANDINIPSNSTARIYSSDLLGTRGIEIVLGDSPDGAKSGDTLRSDVAMSLQEEVNDMVQPILVKAGSMMSSIDTVITAVGEIFNYGTREDLIKSVESLRNTIANIENATKSIDTLLVTQRSRLVGIFKNVESITTNLEDNNEELTRIISNAASISDTIARSNLAGMIANLETSIANLTKATDKISSGEGSIGLLLNDEKLYRDLESSSKQLNLLLEDIRLNPRRYLQFSVFGKSKPYTPPVTE